MIRSTQAKRAIVIVLESCKPRTIAMHSECNFNYQDNNFAGIGCNQEEKDI